MEIEKNENLVTEEQIEQPVEEVAENVETTTEETPKTYTQEEFEAALNARLHEKLDEVMPRKLARREAKIRKEYERKYGNLEEVLRAGTGKENVDEITDTFRDFYEKKGIKIQQKPAYSQRDIEVLARAEADDIIRGGYDEVVEEVERLTKVGYDNMSARDKLVFKALAEHRVGAERGRELSQMGVTEDIYNSKEFTDFVSMFNSDTPTKKIYELFNRETKPKKEYKPMGSMKQGQNTGVKDYYTPEEIERLSEEDLDDPKVWEAVRRSMTGG